MQWVRYEIGSPDRDDTESSLGPFRWDERGKKHRLAWPLGSIELGGFVTPVVWDDTHVVLVAAEALTIVSVHSDRFARLVFGKRFHPKWYDARVVGRDLRLSSDQQQFGMPLAELEQLLIGKSRDEEITVRTVYSGRRPDAKLDCVYLWKLQTGRTMLEVGDGKGGNSRPKLVIDLPFALAKHTRVVLSDELSPGLYARADIAGHPPQTLAVPARPLTFTATLKLGTADHPEGEDRPVVAKADAAARARIETLITAIVNEPEVDGHREVLVDLLQELEDPAAPTFAAVRAGETISAARKKAALGPLAAYFVDYESRAGLPSRATLSRSAKVHTDMLDEALADYRLGLITALRIGLGKHVVNTAFVTAPRATALRDIDITHTKTIDALVAAKRDQFTRIGHLELGKKRFMAKLADPIFDRATTFHAVIRYLSIVDSFMENIVANPKNVFTRVERTLELDLEYGHVDALRASVVAWLPRLPVHAIVVGGVRLK